MIVSNTMGTGMIHRLLGGNQEVVIYSSSDDIIKAAENEGALPSYSIRELVHKLKPPRIVWIMLPTGEISETYIGKVSTFLSEGDILIDSGNSFYKDDIQRKEELTTLGIHYVDIGISGGKNGFCTMVGGDREDFLLIEPILKLIAPADGYLYCGPTGSGHFLKMVHNGIEYALIEAYGEGFEILEASPYKDHLNYREIAHLWNQGSIIKSMILQLLESAFLKDPYLETVKESVDGSREERWTIHQAVDSGVSATSIIYALFKKLGSRQNGVLSDKILAALHRESGDAVSDT